MKHLSVLLCLGVAATTMLPGTASAETIVRSHVSHGTANCQAALPVYDGNIRKRPMALANEGSTSAYITCDSENTNDSGSGFSTIAMGFYNRAGVADVEVSCTLANGVLFSEGYFPKTVTIGAGGVNLMQWTVEDNLGNNFAAPALSCNLPAGVDIGLVQFQYPEEIGAL